MRFTTNLKRTIVITGIFAICASFLVTFPKVAEAKTVVVMREAECVVQFILQKEFYIPNTTECDAWISELDEEIASYREQIAYFNSILDGSAWGSSAKIFTWGFAYYNNSLIDVTALLNGALARRNALQEAKVIGPTIPLADLEAKVQQWQDEVRRKWNATPYEYNCCRIMIVPIFRLRSGATPGTAEEGTPGFDQIAIVRPTVFSRFRSYIKNRFRFDGDGFSDAPYTRDSTGAWTYNDRPDYLAPHESGHELGLIDRYNPTGGGSQTGYTNDVMGINWGSGLPWAGCVAITIDAAGNITINNLETICRGMNVQCPPECCPPDTLILPEPLRPDPRPGTGDVGMLSEPEPCHEGWTDANQAPVKDATTGQPLDGSVTALPKDPQATPKTGDGYSTPQGGDTVVVSAPCHKKKIYVAGADPPPDAFMLEPKPVRFVTKKGDTDALINIRAGLAAQGVTANNVDTKDIPGTTYSEVSVTSYNNQTGACLDGNLPDPDASTCPEDDGWFEPEEPRSGQAYKGGKALKKIGISRDKAAPEKPGFFGGDKPVIVAVIDSGIDAKHPELAGSMWSNDREIADNGTDDDRNGYSDDRTGWNFVDGNGDTRDLNGHGTLVAGIIKAVNPNVVLMPVKVTDFNNTGTSIDLAKGVIYAADKGAKVINISVGGKRLTEIEKAAVRYARKKGAVIVAAAGNGAEEIAYFSPSGIEEIISVGSTDKRDERALFSNWGRGIDLAAPGVDIVSLRAGGTDYLLFDKENYTPGSAIQKNDYYVTSGSSFSAPFVSGVASLLLSENPRLRNDQVKRKIIYSARDIGAPGRDMSTGYGLLDANAARKAHHNFYLEVDIDSVEPAGRPGKQFFEVIGTADSDSLKSARVEIGKSANPTSWKTVGAEIRRPVKKGRLASLPYNEFKGDKEWTIRLVAEHSNGEKREARHLLLLQ